MPMLSKKVEDALNAQVTAEFSASFFYLSLAAYYSALNLDGFAAFMRAQYEDERSHALAIVDLVDSRNGRVRLEQLPAPPVDWSSPSAGIADVVKWESENSERINNLMRLAHEDNDFATLMSLQGLVTEQVQDEAVAREIQEKMRLLESAPGGLFIMDRELRFRAGKG